MSDLVLKYIQVVRSRNNNFININRKKVLLYVEITECL